MITIFTDGILDPMYLAGWEIWIPRSALPGAYMWWFWGTSRGQA